MRLHNPQMRFCFEVGVRRESVQECTLEMAEEQEQRAESAPRPHDLPPPAWEPRILSQSPDREQPTGPPRGQRARLGIFELTKKSDFW